MWGVCYVLSNSVISFLLYIICDRIIFFLTIVWWGLYSYCYNCFVIFQIYTSCLVSWVLRFILKHIQIHANLSFSVFIFHNTTHTLTKSTPWCAQIDVWPLGTLQSAYFLNIPRTYFHEGIYYVILSDICWCFHFL